MKICFLLKAGAIIFSVLSSPLISSSQGAMIDLPPGKEVISDPKKVQFLEGKLTVELDRVPIVFVLSTLKKKCNLRFMLDESLLNEKISTSFKDLSLHDGLKRLLRPFNYIVIQKASLIEQVLVFAYRQPNRNREQRPLKQEGPREREEEGPQVPAERPPGVPPLHPLQEEMIPPSRSEEPESTYPKPPLYNPEEMTPPVSTPGEQDKEVELP